MKVQSLDFKHKRIIRACRAAGMLGLILCLTGCFDSRNIDMGAATAIIPKQMMKYKVGESAIETELYVYSRLKGYDLYIGMVADDYDNGEKYQTIAQEEGTDRYFVNQGENGNLYFEGMVFNGSDQAVLLTCEYGDPAMTSTLESIFDSIQFKDAQE